MLLYSIEMCQWKLQDFALDLLEKKLSLTTPSQDEDDLACEDLALMRCLKFQIYLKARREYSVGLT